MILWVILGAFYTILGPKRYVSGTDYYNHIVLFVFEFDQADDRKT